MKTFCLPDLGEGLQEAEVVSWHVNVGDRVSAETIVCILEAMKVFNEIPAECSGSIVERLDDAVREEQYPGAGPQLELPPR